MNARAPVMMRLYQTKYSFQPTLTLGHALVDVAVVEAVVVVFELALRIFLNAKALLLNSNLRIADCASAIYHNLPLHELLLMLFLLAPLER